jgi:hypothetical protein
MSGSETCSKPLANDASLVAVLSKVSLESKENLDYLVQTTEMVANTGFDQYERGRPMSAVVGVLQQLIQQWIGPSCIVDIQTTEEWARSMTILYAIVQVLCRRKVERYVGTTSSSAEEEFNSLFISVGSKFLLGFMWFAKNQNKHVDEFKRVVRTTLTEWQDIVRATNQPAFLSRQQKICCAIGYLSQTTGSTADKISTRVKQNKKSLQEDLDKMVDQGYLLRTETKLYVRYKNNPKKHLPKPITSFHAGFSMLMRLVSADQHTFCKTCEQLLKRMCARRRNFVAQNDRLKYHIVRAEDRRIIIPYLSQFIRERHPLLMCARFMDTFEHAVWAGLPETMQADMLTFAEQISKTGVALSTPRVKRQEEISALEKFFTAVQTKNAAMSREASASSGEKRRPPKKRKLCRGE